MNKEIVAEVNEVALLEKYKKEIETLKKDMSRMEQELNLAKDIQLNMIPRDLSSFNAYPQLEIYAKLIPAREVGGDFYDLYWIDKDHLAFTVADVSGKGVAAGFMMAICKALLKSKAEGQYSTAAIFTHVNNQLAVHNPDCMFITAFMGILNINTGELTYSNAGHNPTFIKRNNGTLDKLTNLHGPVLAAMPGLTYKEDTTKLNTQDVIFAYTDGITEAHDLNNNLFDEKRLVKRLNQEFTNARNLVEQLVVDILMFERGAEQFDDITAVCIQLKA